MARHKLPIEVRNLVHARNALRDRYSAFGLSFTLDGNLVGDLGEAVAAELFGLKLAGRRGLKAIDAYAPDGSSIQIKATGRGKSFPFTHSEEPAKWLLALVLYYDEEEVEIVYNGLYAPAIRRIQTPWLGQKHVTVHQLRALDASVLSEDRLHLAN